MSVAVMGRPGIGKWLLTFFHLECHRKFLDMAAPGLEDFHAIMNGSGIFVWDFLRELLSKFSQQLDEEAYPWLSPSL